MYVSLATAALVDPKDLIKSINIIKKKIISLYFHLLPLNFNTRHFFLSKKIL